MENKITRRGFLKLVGGLAATAVGSSLTACKDKGLDKIDEITIYDTAFNNGLDSLFDDIFANYPEIQLTSYHQGKETPINVSIADASNLMEKSLKISELFNKNSNLLKQFKDEDTIETIENENEAIELDIEELEQLIEDLNNDSLTPQEKKQSARILNYLEKYYKTWLDKNNPIVAENLLLILFKSYGCELENLNPENYDQVIVGSGLEPNDYTLTVNSPSEKKEEVTYIINEKESGIVYECLISLYNCQDIIIGDKVGYEKSDEEKTKIITDAIHNIKCGILCGVKVKDGILHQGKELTNEVLEEVDTKKL